jgi:hypothetical protein
MQFEPDKISSYYNSSSKPSFLFYRASVVVSMVALLSVLGINLYLLNETTSTTSKAAGPSSENVQAPSFTTPTTIQSEPSDINQQALPPLPAQCSYETSTDGNIIKCTEAGKSCIYKIVNNRYVMTCDKS